MNLTEERPVFADYAAQKEWERQHAEQAKAATKNAKLQRSTMTPDERDAFIKTHGEKKYLALPW